MPPGNLYYIAGSFGNPEIVKVVSDQEVFDCPDLYSTQEETDTRMILQALHADKRLKELGKQDRIIIKTSDTDVIVLCIYFDKQMTNTSELWVQMDNASSVKDGQKSFASSYHNINKLRVKFATGRMQVSIFFVPHARPKFGILPVWQNHLCLHQ